MIYSFQWPRGVTLYHEHYTREHCTFPNNFHGFSIDTEKLVSFLTLVDRVFIKKIILLTSGSDHRGNQLARALGHSYERPWRDWCTRLTLNRMLVKTNDDQLPSGGHLRFSRFVGQRWNVINRETIGEISREIISYRVWSVSANSIDPMMNVLQRQIMIPFRAAYPSRFDCFKSFRLQTINLKFFEIEWYGERRSKSSRLLIPMREGSRIARRGKEKRGERKR